jgi:TldD protein
MAPPILSLSVRTVLCSRRAWLGYHAAVLTRLMSRSFSPTRRPGVVDRAQAAQLIAQTVTNDPTPWQALAHQGVETARAAGAQYADVRLTRTCGQRYAFGAGIDDAQCFAEVTGVGVRALVNGTWGFAACPWPTAEAVAGVARDAVAQATVNAQRRGQPVEWVPIPVVQGTWTTPMRIDPFAISIDEKRDYIAYIQAYGDARGISSQPFSGALEIHRQERVLATSEGTLVTQTCFETGAAWQVDLYNQPLGQQKPSPELGITGLVAAGLGWEHILDADIPGQLREASERLQALVQLQKHVKPAPVGRYTLVCDGATMAALLDRTLGVATQLDRALGYEANAAGTSFLDDPLGMVGHFQVAAPLITVTANRTTPGDLATVCWDDEGVAAESFTLVKDGVLVDFQTTRAQAGWLAPYYTKAGRPVTSHGCAAAEDALGLTLAMQPNLALAPGAPTVRMDDLVANVTQGILVTGGDVTQVDSQAWTGVLVGQMQEIRNGRLGPLLAGGAVLFDTLDLWKHVIALGGAATVGTVVAPRPSGGIGNWGFLQGTRGIGEDPKGEPPQSTSRTTRGVAAVIVNQPVIDLGRKA